MSENANNIPLDDEDILDLTVVAEPGKSAVRADGPPEMGDSDSSVDFGADLDALLDSLGADGTVTAPPAKAATAKPVAAPIADQTPVDHAVDPDEEMAMPEMSDIDSLLAELGAEIPAKASAQAAPEPPEPPEPPAPKATAPIAEFEDLFAKAQAAEAEKAKEEAAAMMAEMMAAPAAQAAPKVSAVPNMVAMEEEFAEAPAPKAASPAVKNARAVPADPEDVPGAKEADGEALDLNELDALLDDILATAPEVSSPAAKAAAPAPAAPEARAGEDFSLPEPSPAPDAALAALAAGMAAQAAPAPRMEEIADVIPVPDQAIMPVSEDLSALSERVLRLEEADFAALAERVQRLEESVGILESEEVSESMIEGFIDAKLNAKLESLFIPESPVMERICEEIRGRLAEGYFNESLEKMAAAAAAKVIREEITALMEENG